MLPDPLPTPRVTRGGWRLGRAVVASIACVMTAVLGHRVGGGEVPAGVVALLLVAATAVAWVLAGRRIVARQVVGLLVICQVVVHLAFSGHEMVMGPAMVLSHVGATALCTLLVTRAERWAWALAERLVLRPLALLSVVEPPRVARVVSRLERLAAAEAVRRLLPVRGPPVAV